MKQDDLKELLSAWIDNEARADQAAFNYKRLCENSEHKQSFAAYQAIGAVIRGESSGYCQPGFAASISEAVSQEPAHRMMKSSPQIKKLLSGWAVAASVALAIIVGVQWQPVAESTANPANNIAAVGENGHMLAEYHVTDSEKAQLERIDNIFSQYAQQSQVSSDGSVPYVRLVSGEQVKTFRMTPQQFRQVMVELERRNKEAELKAQQEILKNP